MVRAPPRVPGFQPVAFCFRTLINADTIMRPPLALTPQRRRPMRAGEDLFPPLPDAQEEGRRSATQSAERCAEAA